MLTAILVATAALVVLGPIGVARGRAAANLVHFGSIAATSVVLGHAVWFLFDGTPTTLTLPFGLPWLAAHFRIDALSAWFLSVISLVGLTAAIYGFGYIRHVDEPGRVLPFFPLFLAAMNLVLIADDAFTFLLSWECMSLASWFLVVANHRQPDNARAALVYLVMAVIGTSCLLLAFGIMAGFEGAYSFADMRAAPVTGRLGGLAVALVVIGAGSKAGLVPLHAWLPLAHPAAPSHISALMSGVMTKVAIYGLVRVMFDLAGDLGWGWGAVLLVLGGASAVLGILYALMQNDLKVLLAYSTVENVGIIVIGLGLALVFKANGLVGLAALAQVAALLHVLNHALFKSLLFFGSGCVLSATGERDMERLGGLIHRMPRTAFLFLVGSAAISALPPFNGFASEWLTFQAILNAPVLPQWVLKFGVPVVGALLALAAALAAACFVRAFGITFLGRPRSDAAAQAAEVEPAMWGAMAVLAACCLVLGVLPTAAIVPLNAVVRDLLGSPFPALSSGVAVHDFLFLAPLEPGRSSYSGLLVLAVVALVTWVVARCAHRLASPQVRRGPPWDCGFPDPQPATQYTASSFAQPIRRVYGTLIFRARERVDMPEPGDSRPARFAVHLIDPAWEAFYAPIERGVAAATARANVLQFLTIRRYLSPVFAALIALLCIVVLAK
ncbi:MAG: hydrogenase 4 subunit B [Proteobacteria bacterium]|nr:hydrogenase 4 subunit B [Pseudomonadota bacterium]